MGGGGSKFKKLTREQILTLYKAGPEAVVSLVEYLQDSTGFLKDEIEQLKKRLRDVEDQLRKDSHNSSKPPSSDGFKKIVKVRKPSGKKPGGQRGHEGKTLRMAENPDKVKIHKVKYCEHCGKSLKKKKPIGYDRRQVFDLPPKRVEVTEHCGEIKECDDCGKLSTAEFPEDVTHKVQYGPGLKAHAAYIKNYALLPYERAAELFEDLFGVPLSAGTLVRIDREVAGRLEEVNERIKENIIRSSAAVHFDETGMRIEGKLHWLHVAGTEALTYYIPHAKRGSDAFDAIGILPRFEGRAVHDGWSSYFKYGCGHVLCNAHHLREMTFIEEQYGQQWAKKMIEFLLEVKEKREKSKARRFSSKTIQEFEQRYRDIVAMGMAANPPPQQSEKKRGRKKKSKAANLLERLQQHAQATLAFMYDFSVPFDNNLGYAASGITEVMPTIGLCRVCGVPA